MQRVRHLIARIAAAVAVATAVALVGFLLVAPRLLGGTTLSVLSGSMSPTIPTGSVVLIKPVTDLLSLEPGDIITFQASPTERSLITHRVVRFQPDTDPPTYITKGDANASPDTEPVPIGAIRGEVVTHVPYLGRATAVLGGFRGASLLATAMGMMFIAYHVKRIFGAIRDDGTVPERDEPLEPTTPLERETMSEDPSLEAATVATAHTSVSLTTDARIEYQLLLASLAAGAFERGQVLEILGLVRGQVVALSPANMIVSVAGSPDQLDGVERLLRPYGLLQVQRSSVVAVGGSPLDHDEVASPTGVVVPSQPAAAPTEGPAHSADPETRLGEGASPSDGPEARVGAARLLTVGAAVHGTELIRATEYRG